MLLAHYYYFYCYYYISAKCQQCRRFFLAVLCTCGLWVCPGLQLKPCCRYTFSRAKNGSAKVQLANWKSKAAAPPSSTRPPQRNQSELELRLDNVPWLIMCDSLKPSSVPGRTYIEINVMAQWAYNIYTLYHIYYAYNMQIELRVFYPIAATCEVCHSPSTPSIQIYINHLILYNAQRDESVSNVKN